MSLIEDDMYLSKQKALADADFYAKEREAAGNQQLLTKEYLELRRYEAIASNNKVYFGRDIPNMFYDTSPKDEKPVATLAAAGRASNNNS